ncbi:MAG: histidine utilization repressor [Rhodobacteraceae bacterium]|nr:histidine utilization repressor [Paracoccaceae bacterium]
MTTRRPPDNTLHQRILKDLEGKIVSGAWPAGHRLPFEVDLARSYGCSRMTVNKVMTELVRAGLIERRKRSGSFVLEPKVASAVLEIPDIQQEVETRGLCYAFTLDRRTRRIARAADQRHLDLADAGPVLALTCTHFASGRPFCIEDRLINLATVPDADSADFTVIPPGQWLLQQVPWTAAEHRIQAVNAAGPVADQLRLDPGAACLVMERRTWGGDGPVTHVRLTYPGDRHSLVARFEPSAP